MRTVAHWWKIIQDSLNSKEYKVVKDSGKLSRMWYMGKEQFNEKDRLFWEGDQVRGNLWQRDYDILFSSVYSRSPGISVVSKLNDSDRLRFTSAATELAERIWVETDVDNEVKNCYRQALHDNVSFVELDYDKARQVPSVKWVDGNVAVDPKCNGVYKRARWVAKVVERTLIDVVSDTTFSEEILDKLQERVAAKKDDDVKIDMEQTVKMAYIYSKFGDQPWKKIGNRKLIIIAEDMPDEVMLTEGWAWPFLDADQFPLIPLRIKEVDGGFWGVTLFSLLKPLFSHFNWAASFNLADARKAATRKILVSDNVEEAEKITSGNHLETIKVSGDPKSAIFPIDFGTGSEIVWRTMEFAKQLHDEQSGITDIARGVSPGDRTTAEEARLLDRNSSITFQEIAKQVDTFLGEVARVFVQAMLYYVPQWSRVVNQMGDTIIRSYEIIQLPTGLEVMPQDMPIDPTEAESLPQLVKVNKVVRPGVDKWIGVDHALSWIDMDVDEIKREFAISIEAGSTRASHMVEKQRNTLTLLQTLGPIYQQMGFMEQYHELLKRFINSFPLSDRHRLLPPLETFAQATFVQEPKKEGQGQAQQQNPAQQPGAQTLGMNFGPEGLRGAGTPDGARQPEMGVPDMFSQGLAQRNTGAGVS